MQVEKLEKAESSRKEVEENTEQQPQPIVYG